MSLQNLGLGSPYALSVVDGRNLTLTKTSVTHSPFCLVARFECLTQKRGRLHTLVPCNLASRSRGHFPEGKKVIILIYNAFIQSDVC